MKGCKISGQSLSHAMPPPLSPPSTWSPVVDMVPVVLPCHGPGPPSFECSLAPVVVHYNNWQSVSCEVLCQTCNQVLHYTNQCCQDFNSRYIAIITNNNSILKQLSNNILTVPSEPEPEPHLVSPDTNPI